MILFDYKLLNSLYSVSGFFAAALTLILPVLSEIYWFYWFGTNVGFGAKYCVLVMVYVGLLVIVWVIVFLVFMSAFVLDSLKNGARHQSHFWAKWLTGVGDHRMHRRVRVRWPTTLVTSSHESIDGMTRNLGLGGVFLYYSHTDPRALPIRVDDHVNVVFKIPGHDHIQASARVACSDILGVEETSTLLGVGLEFASTSHEDREHFLQVVTEGS
jgi:hypothetical protein